MVLMTGLGCFSTCQRRAEMLRVNREHVQMSPCAVLRVIDNCQITSELHVLWCKRVWVVGRIPDLTPAKVMHQPNG